MEKTLNLNKNWFIKFVLVFIILFSLIGGTTQSSAQAPEPETEPHFSTIELPEDAKSWKPELSQQESGRNKNPKLDSVFTQLASSVNEVSRQSIIESRALRVSNGRVQVQISTSPEKLEGAVTAVEQAGGTITKTSEEWSLIQAWLPIQNLESTANHKDINYIRQPYEIIPTADLNAGSQTTEGLAAINGDAWHTVGYNGAGVKVGIIDAGFLGYSSLLGTDLPGSVVVKNFVDGETDPQVDGTTKHGTACAEVIYDIAPGASMYLVKINTLLDLVEAVTWLKDVQSVDIISTSMVFYNVSPGDGTGILEDIVSDTRDAGITWITGAGNDRQVHWGGAYNDPGGNDSHYYTTESNINIFGPGDSTAYSIPTGYPISIFLRWDDWTVVNQDYDLYLIRWTGSTWETVASSENYQDGSAGQFPTESINYVTTDATSAYGFVIARWDSNRNVNLEVSAPNMLHLNYYIYDRSLANLADAESVMTVSALDVNSPYPQESYSSQGPTNGPGGIATGGFTKPDIAGFANVSTVSYGTTDKFNGTSSATPHVAGAAAIVLSAYPAYTPNQLQTFLEDRTVDMGTAGMDNIYGYGRLYLGDPPSVVTGPIVTSINPDTGENTGVISVSISGENFDTGASVKLTKTGQADIISSSVTVPNANQVNCNFDLAGAVVGAWNVVVTNPDEESGSLADGFTITSPTSPAPNVISINPNTGENTGSIAVTITGTNFEGGAGIKLTKSSQSDIIANSVTVPNANQINCSFDLTGAAVGAWNVVVTNPDDQTDTLTGGFTVTSTTPSTWSSYLPLILNGKMSASDPIINGDFEQGHTGWVEDSSGGYELITEDSYYAQSGSWFAYLGDYHNAVDSVYQSITIPPTMPYLHFWIFLGSEEPCGSNNDLFLVGIDADAVAGIELCSGNNLSDYAHVYVDLSTYASQTVNLQFVVVTDSSLYSGLFLDNVYMASDSSGTTSSTIFLEDLPVNIDNLLYPER